MLLVLLMQVTDQLDDINYFCTDAFEQLSTNSQTKHSKIDIQTLHLTQHLVCPDDRWYYSANIHFHELFYLHSKLETFQSRRDHMHMHY